MKDLSLARDSSEKQAKKAMDPDSIASLILTFHSSPGPSFERSRQYGMFTASSTAHS